jgi:hypothetical protein
MPTIVRIRARLAEMTAEDITIDQAVWVFGVESPTPITLRISRGEISAAKVMGEWRIDVASLNAYLDKLNSKYNRSI